jgi:Na+/H+ antiporter NhaC
VFYAAGALFVGLIAGTILDQMFMTCEGAAWSGISLGLPLGLVLAIVGMFWGFVRTKRRFKPAPAGELEREKRY